MVINGGDKSRGKYGLKRGIKTRDFFREWLTSIRGETVLTGLK